MKYIIFAFLLSSQLLSQSVSPISSSVYDDNVLLWLSELDSCGVTQQTISCDQPFPYRVEVNLPEYFWSYQDIAVAQCSQGFDIDLSTELQIYQFWIKDGVVECLGNYCDVEDPGEYTIYFIADIYDFNPNAGISAWTIKMSELERFDYCMTIIIPEQ